MYTLTVLLFAVFTACTIARPPGPTLIPDAIKDNDPLRVRAPLPSPKELLREYLLPRYFMSGYVDWDAVTEELPLLPRRGPSKWLNKEIVRINRMGDDIMSPYDIDLSPMYIQDEYNLPYLAYKPPPNLIQNYVPESPIIEYMNPELLNPKQYASKPFDLKPFNSKPSYSRSLESAKSLVTKKRGEKSSDTHKKMFASTPLDKEFYAPKTEVVEEGISSPAMYVEEPKVRMLQPRMTRQNPNMSRQKTLVAENLDRLRAGLINKEYRMPVSLVPANLEWLKINHDGEESHESGGTTNSPHHIHVQEATDPAQSIYSVALIAAVGAALTMAIMGFAIGWYKLSKRAKAAAEVDYPAYGVTGPTVDPSGDRKLAHSAHMYHYQHQKQQIIAMERNGCEQGNASMSDPDSEEENEEGDYTVYEWPGFATTGDMEVKNPLFKDESTPATPGKFEIVKPKPKE